jgi:hypothetical protein
MKTLLTLASSLALATLLLPAQAQTPATGHDNPTPAKPTAKPSTQRGTAYKQAQGKGQTVGHKLVEKSKPYDSPVPSHPRKSIE